MCLCTSCVSVLVCVCVNIYPSEATSGVNGIVIKKNEKERERELWGGGGSLRTAIKCLVKATGAARGNRTAASKFDFAFPVYFQSAS